MTNGTGVTLAHWDKRIVEEYKEPIREEVFNKRQAYDSRGKKAPRHSRA